MTVDTPLVIACIVGYVIGFVAVVVARRLARRRAAARLQRGRDRVQSARDHHDALLALQPADLEYLAGLGWSDPLLGERQPPPPDPRSPSCVCGHSTEPHDPAVHAASTYPNLGDPSPWDAVNLYTYWEERRA